jgi:type I restriction enzyme S subunit
MAQPFSEFITIGDIADVKGGKRLPKGMVVHDEKTPHPYLRVVDFNDDGLDRSKIKYIDDNAFVKVKRYTISSTDVYISIAGTIGRVGVIPNDLSGANLTENAAKITNISGEIDRIFLMYFLRSHLGQSEIASKVVGTSQPKLALFRIQELRVPKVPLHTQRKIAAILSAYDDLIENNLRRIKILEEMAQNLYHEWFVKFRFPGYQHARFTDSPIGRIPEGWEVKTVENTFAILGGGTPLKAIPEYWDEGTINWYSPTDLTATGSMFMERSGKQISELGLKKSSARLFPPFSVMMTSRATLGVISINTTEACTNQGFITCVPNEHFPLYTLFYWLKENVEYFISLGTGATFKEITKGVFKTIELVVPAYAIVTKFEDTVQQFTLQVLNLQRKNTSLRRTRDLLLPKLISGEVDVSELDIAVSEETKT